MLQLTLAASQGAHSLSSIAFNIGLQLRSTEHVFQWFLPPVLSNAV